ncbi:hypothetical protein [Fusobacterium polymorphum]|uniref:hypothetical protein n=1 Tax=Fusobacterium nucleatum subsp. polymorphum TaxID=76857 RepID=UPI0030085933
MSRKNKGEVWFAKFQFEEIEGFKYRPVVVLDDGNFDTDVPILYWQEAKLKFESFVRIDKYLLLDDTDFSFKIGDLHQDDLNLIETKFMEYILNHK